MKPLLWSEIRAGDRTSEGYLVGDLGLVIVSPEDEEMATQLGGDPFVEIEPLASEDMKSQDAASPDAASDDSFVPQFTIARFIPHAA